MAVEDAVIVYIGSNAQPLNDVINFGGRPLDLTTATGVKFKLRYATSSDIKVDATANIVSSTKAQVAYQWTDSDLDEQGEFYGWWNVTLPDGDLDTPEFLIVIAEHAPGDRTTTGSIARATRSIIPITWDALSRNYGDALLQERIEVVKLRVFGQAVSVSNESTYDPRVINFIGKLAALELIPTGVDYWLDQHVTVTTQGTQEMVSFPDRIDALWKIYERLTLQVGNDRGIIEDILGVVQTIPNIHTPVFNGPVEDGFKTPVSSDFYDYAFPKKGSWTW